MKEFEYCFAWSSETQQSLKDNVALNLFANKLAM